MKKPCPTGKKKFEALVYLVNNSFLCTAFAQSLSREEILGMLRCNDETI